MTHLLHHPSETPLSLASLSFPCLLAAAPSHTAGREPADNIQDGIGQHPSPRRDGTRAMAARLVPVAELDGKGERERERERVCG